MKRNSTLIAAASFFLLFICIESNGQDLSAIKKEIGKDNALYFDLFKKADVAIVNLYTEDGCLMPPNNPPVNGRVALTKDFKDTYADGKIQGVRFSTVEIYGDGVLYVTEEGDWQVFDKNDQVIDDGKYIKLWKKTKQGWKIYRDLFSSVRKAS